MARIEKRGNRWRARVRIGGNDISESFATKADARAWAAKVETESVAGKLGRAVDRTVRELVQRYIEDVVPSKRGSRSETMRLQKLVREDDLARVRLPDLDQSHIAAWRDRRLRSVSAGSVLREWNSLSAAFSTATREWRWLPANPMLGVKRPQEPAARTRRISDAEVDALLYCCGYYEAGTLDTEQSRVGACLLFALETAMRAGEICGLREEDVDRTRRVAKLAMTKNGTSREVPLSPKALAILDRLGPALFDITPASLDALFRKARKRAQLEGFTFHDARATALTRLARIFTPLELAKISGHKDLNLLSRVYYREDVASLADKLR